MKITMIIHMTYLSGDLRVKGYLSLPHGYEYPISELQAQVAQLYGTQLSLPITPLSNSIHSDRRDIRSDKWPVLIYCRGGIGKVGQVKTQWLEQFSSFGHIVFAPSYRGMDGGEGRDEFGGSDTEDVIAAFHLIKSLPFVDQEHISVMGFSRGSINATYTATQLPDVRKLILWGGVSDLAQTYAERVDLRRMFKRVIGGTPTKYPASYEARSPIHMTGQIGCPVLIMHGTQDEQVDISHGSNMYDKLHQAGNDVVIHRYDGHGHHFPPDIHQKAIERMFQWICT